jgi:hypothetical protein
MSQSQVLAQYPHLAPGLCGALECPRLCVRSQHCEAGQRRARRLFAAQRRRRNNVKPNREQLRVCKLIQDEGLCPTLCNRCGGCFLPQPYDSVSELKRKAHRPQWVIGALVRLREDQQEMKEVSK